MTKASDVINTPQRGKQSYSALIIWGVVYFVLLLLRDSYSVGINKYIFLAIICVCAVHMKTNHLVYLFCFLFPLYVGLPGNYMTIVLLVRLIIEIRQYRASSFVLSMALAAYVFIQNLITGYTDIVPMMYIPSVLVVLLLFTYKPNLEPLPMIVMYSAGVAALGLIMLLSTLNVYDLTDLLSTSFRLGSASVDYVEEGIMNVSVDPNFYGMFSIASISLAFPLIFHHGTKPVIKVFLSLFVLTQLTVALIGLSRAFILVATVWMLLYLLTQKSFKGTIIAFLTIFVIIGLLFIFIPDVIETVLARFDDTDMDTGNGRITLIQEFWDEWGSSAATMFFGVGLFACNVHCMPLQFFFGGGIVMFALVAALFLSYCTFAPTKRSLSSFLPFVVTFTMMCTIPAAAMLNAMFPLVLVGLSMHSIEKDS